MDPEVARPFTSWFELIPADLRIAVLIAVALYFIFPLARRTWIEYRHRTHELSKLKTSLEIAKLKYEISLLSQQTGDVLEDRLVQSAAEPGAQPIQAPFNTTVIEGASAQDQAGKLSSRTRCVIGFFSSLLLGGALAIAAYEDDPGPTAGILAIWVLAGMGSAAAFGGESRLKSMFAGVFVPPVFFIVIGLLVS